MSRRYPTEKNSTCMSWTRIQILSNMDAFSFKNKLQTWLPPPSGQGRALCRARGVWCDIPRDSRTRRRTVPLQSRFFQVVEVWHSRTSGPGKADAVLPDFAGHLVGVGGPFGTGQGWGMPAGLDLPRQRVVVGLATLCVGGDTAYRKPPGIWQIGGCFGGGVRERLEAQFGGAVWRRRRRLASRRGRGRRGEMQQLTQRFQRLVLKGQDTTSSQ